MTLEITRALKVGSKINLGTDNSVLFIKNGKISEDNVNLNFNTTTDLLTVGDIETLDTKGIVVPFADAYGFTLKGLPTTGFFFNVAGSKFEFHLAGEVMATIEAVTGQGDITAKRNVYATQSVVSLTNGIQAETFFKAIGTGVSHALEIPNNCYAFSQSSGLTTGLYFNNNVGNIEMHLTGVVKHTFEMINGDYTAGRNIKSTGGYSSAISTKTGAYTLTITDSTILADSSSAAFTLTLPTAVGISGRKYTIKKTDSSTNIITVDGNGTETIDGALTFDLELQHESIEVQSDGTNWWII